VPSPIAPPQIRTLHPHSAWLMGLLGPLIRQYFFSSLLTKPQADIKHNGLIQSCPWPWKTRFSLSDVVIDASSTTRLTNGRALDTSMSYNGPNPAPVFGGGDVYNLSRISLFAKGWAHELRLYLSMPKMYSKIIALAIAIQSIVVGAENKTECKCVISYPQSIVAS